MNLMLSAATTDSAIEIGNDVHWIGAFDPDLRAFDLILRTANGTTYNAYVVRGSEGVAVIDTVKEAFAGQFFSRFESVADYEEIRYIVLNHLEPDHSGALPELMRRAPQARLVISTRAPMMLKGLLKASDDEGGGQRCGERVLDYLAVGGGDHISLGKRSLSFLHTPFLHWPDTQCTWLEDEGILFSGDVFGCHFCDTRLFNDAVGDFRFSFESYYGSIMRPFREHMCDALDQIEPLPFKVIAPAHGPILRHTPRHYVRRYRELCGSTLTNEAATTRTLLVFYLSAYGNTRRMAEAIAAGAEEVDDVRVSLYDIEGGDILPFVDLIEEADGLVFGSPTINGDAVKPVWDLLSSLTRVKVRGKLAAAFGSYGWSGEAMPLIEDRLRGLKLRVPLRGLRIKLIPSEDELEVCRRFGRDLALHLTGRQEKKPVIDLAELS